ncbi:hypothetical protein MRX96_003663 [Rhipicephalus microplus]
MTRKELPCVCQKRECITLSQQSKHVSASFNCVYVQSSHCYAAVPILRNARIGSVHRPKLAPRTMRVGTNNRLVSGAPDGVLRLMRRGCDAFFQSAKCSAESFRLSSPPRSPRRYCSSTEHAERGSRCILGTCRENVVVHGRCTPHLPSHGAFLPVRALVSDPNVPGGTQNAVEKCRQSNKCRLCVLPPKSNSLDSR